MPGMMDTVLNLGLNDISIQGLIKKSGNERFAWDSYRRFMQMFGNVVMNVGSSKFEEELENAKATKGVEYDTDLDTEDMKKVVEKYKEVVKKETGEDFPQEPKKQLQKSIDAVFGLYLVVFHFVSIETFRFNGDYLSNPVIQMYDPISFGKFHCFFSH